MPAWEEFEAEVLDKFYTIRTVIWQLIESLITALWRLIQPAQLPAARIFDIVRKLTQPDRHRLSNVIQSKLAGAVVWLTSRLPLLSLLFFSDQWGENVRSLYFIFAVEDYWVQRFWSNWGNPEIQSVGFQLLQLFLARLDFMIRYVLGFVYGNHWVQAPAKLEVQASGDALSTLPIAYSNVAYINIKDGETSAEKGPNDNVIGSFTLQGNALARQELYTFTKLTGSPPSSQPCYPPIYSMAEAAWLAYEEARVVHNILNQSSFGWEVERSIVLEFVSVTYSYPSGVKKELPLDTQLMLSTKGNMICLAFRGSQPGNFFDWVHNFTLASSSTGSSYAAMGAITATELSGYNAEKHDSGKWIDDNFEQQQGQRTKYVRLHEGFATDLGLQLHPTSKPEVGAPGLEPQSFRCVCYAPEGFNLVKPLPSAGKLQTPRVFNLPQDKHDFLTSEGDTVVQPKEDDMGSPYALLRSLITKELKKNDRAHLYVTGHSLGGALAAVFATKFASDATAPEAERVHLVTFGEPMAGGHANADIMKQVFATDQAKGRYARVVHMNDGVPRVPQYFPDTGERFLHGDGEDVTWYIDHEHKMQAGSGEAPKFQQLALRNWQGLASSWKSLKLFDPVDPATYQSSWRFVINVLLAPLGFINDHLDYKAILRSHTTRYGLQTKENGHVNGHMNGHGNGDVNGHGAGNQGT